MNTHTSTQTEPKPVRRLQGGGRGAAKLTLGAAALLAALAHVVPARAAEDHVKIEFHRCTAAEQVTINAAFAQATNALALAIADLNAEVPAPEIEKAADLLFGRSTALKTIAQNLNHIAARLSGDANPIEVTCHRADTTVYAWVPGEDCPAAHVAELHLAGLFFNAPAREGFDSRMGTIIHEVAHMAPHLGANCAADREEWYGKDEVLLLGRLDPVHALANAQSYEYFVEVLYGR